MDEHDDAVLVELAAGSDLDAFAELVRRHQSFVYGAALRVVRNPTQAEDLVQETFLRAYRALPDFRGESTVRSWLYRIATNLALNAVTRAREVPTDELPERSGGVGPERHAVSAAMHEALVEAMGELPDDLRHPLVLREVDHLSYEEIADRLGIPLNTVRTRIFRARRAVRERMQPWT